MTSSKCGLRHYKRGLRNGLKERNKYVPAHMAGTVKYGHLMPHIRDLSSLDRGVCLIETNPIVQMNKAKYTSITRSYVSEIWQCTSHYFLQVEIIDARH